MKNNNLTLAQQIRYNNIALNNGTMTCQLWWDFIATIEDKELLKTVIAKVSAANERLRNYCSSPLYTNKVRKYAMRHMYTDVHAYEVVNVINNKRVEVRRLDATLVSKMEFQIGGFSAHCTNNNNQEYTFTSNTENPIITIRLNKSGWSVKGSNFRMSDTPYEHYDYNF